MLNDYVKVHHHTVRYALARARHELTADYDAMVRHVATFPPEDTEAGRVLLAALRQQLTDVHAAYADLDAVLYDPSNRCA